MKKSKRKTLKYVNYCLTAILMAVITWLAVLLVSYRMISPKILALILITITILVAVLYKFKFRKTLIGLQIIMIIICFFGIKKIEVTIDAFAEMNQQSMINEETMYILTLKDSGITTIGDLKDKEVSAPISFDEANIQQISAELTENNISIKETKSYVASYQALINQEVPAMIFNASYITLLEDVYPDFLNDTNIIFEKVLIKQKDITEEQPKEKIQKRVLTIYLSGIDTYGTLDKVSRSDSNVLVTINKDTGRILLTNTPRDSFVKIPGPGNNQYDKLTHAGVYGVETSMATLEELYDIDIDYYVRVNFTSLVNIIEVLGGIEVYNSQAFVSRHSNINFPEGEVTLTADTVLPFVRERYALSSGDYDRGRNHEKVITAMIKKMMTPAILLNYDKYLSAIAKSVQTNLTLEDMATLINEQVDTGQTYVFDSQDLSGQGAMSTTCYSMQGQNLYIMNVDENSLKQMKAKIYGIMEGK